MLATTNIINRVVTNRTVWWFFFIAVVSFTCFLPTIYNELLSWDDLGMIVWNTRIHSLTSETFSWAFTSNYMDTWVPLTWISLAVDYAFWDLNPVGYHLSNTMIHALNSGMCFLLALTLFKSRPPSNGNSDVKPVILNGNGALYGALLAALLFALHPLRVESVAWATERKDVLYLFFGIPAILAYLRHANDCTAIPKDISAPHCFLFSRYYWLAVAFYCLSLLSKPMLMTLPVVFLVLDWFPLHRFSRKALTGILLEKTPLLLCAGIASQLTMRALGPIFMPYEQTNLVSRILIAGKSIMAYLWITVWPVGINPLYAHPGKSLSEIGPEYIIPVILFFTITAACLFAVRKQPVFLTVWLVYLLTIAPVLGINQNGPQAMAARFTYASGIAIAILVSLGVTVTMRKISKSRPAFFLGLLGIIGTLMMYCIITRQDISYWKNDVTLWTRVIDLTPHSSETAYFLRSREYYLMGDYQKALDDAYEAVKIAASKGSVLTPEIHLLLARIFKQLGKYDLALTAYTNAARLSPSPDRFSVYIAERGYLYLQMGRGDLANRDFIQAGATVQKK